MRRTLGFMTAALLLSLTRPTTALAQFSYGYDSYNYGNYQPSMTYYYTSGYSQIYTDASNGMYGNGRPPEPRRVAPYQAPPYGSFTTGSSLPAVTANNGTSTARVPARTTATVPPRGPLRRIFRRR